MEAELPGWGCCLVLGTAVENIPNIGLKVDGLSWAGRGGALKFFERPGNKGEDPARGMALAPGALTYAC
jgi:hypothetical protein